jgi:hypothetical protein
MELSIMQRGFSPSKERVAYNSCRKEFSNLANQAVSRFTALYQSNASLEDVIQNAPGQFQEALQPVLERCVAILLEHDVLTVDTQLLLDTYGEQIDAWSPCYMKIRDQYAEIVLNEEDLDQYRQERRQNRGRVIGGGFGFSGAVKGMATAGAMNMALGAGHMLINGLGKITSSIAASSKKSKVFRDPDTLATLQQGVGDTAFKCHYALIAALKQFCRDATAYNGAVTPEAGRAAAAMVQNAQKVTDPQRALDILMQALELDPYLSQWYLYMLERFGDADGNLERVADYFGVKAIRARKEEQLHSFAASLSLETEEQAVQAQRQVQEYSRQLGLCDETEDMRHIDDVVAQFDQAYRTVDELEFNTRAEADRARAELDKIFPILKQVNFDNLASVQSGHRALSGYQTEIGVKYQRILRDRERELIDQMRSVDPLLPNVAPILCADVDEAAKMRQETEHLHRHLLDCQGAGDKMESQLLAFQHELKQADNPTQQVYLTEVQQELSKIDLSCRTALGREYPSRDAAATALNAYDEIRAGFVAGEPRRHADELRNRIEQGDFPDEVKQELNDELFQYENAKELKTAKTFSTFSSIVLLAVIIGSFFFTIAATPEFVQKDVVVLHTSLLVQGRQVVPELSFVDGLINGLVVFGRSIGEMFTVGFHEYKAGFDHGLVGNVLWGFIGFFWQLCKQMIVVIPKYLVSLVLTCAQHGSIGYYVGYVIGSAIPLSVSQLSFNEEDSEGNVKRIKNWTFGKVLRTVLIVLAVAAVAVYFLVNGG